jgi:hypothetical protein
MTTRYLDSDNFTKSFLNKYNTDDTLVQSYQVLADTFHDNINVLKKVKNPTVFEDNLLVHSKKVDRTIKDLSQNFTEFVYADLDKNDSLQIKQKMKSELFVVDVFSGSYQIPGINNLLDCIGNQNATTVKKKLNFYTPNSPTCANTNIFNCDELLFSYFKNDIRTKLSGINLQENLRAYNAGDTTGASAAAAATAAKTKKDLYNNLVNCFWKKLIEIVKILLIKDKAILEQDNYNIQYAINILNEFEFSFDIENFKLYLKHKLDNTKQSEWVPTQKSLAKEIRKIGKDNSIATPNVKERDEEGEIKEHQTDCINAIKSYYNNDTVSNTQILVLSLCKFLGDTSHIVMAYILLHEKPVMAAEEAAATKAMAIDISEPAVNKGTPIKINLQLSERPMLIRNCLPDTDVLNNFGINDTHLKSLIILVKKMKKLNYLITNKHPSDKDDIDTKNCWSYTRDQEYDNKLNIDFLISLIEKLKNETAIEEFTIQNTYKSNIDNNNNKIDKDVLTRIKTSLDNLNIVQLENVENVKKILTELYKLCIANKVKDEYRENSHTKQILEQINESMMQRIKAVLDSRSSDKTILWDYICKITKIGELEYFETLLNYNQSIKLLKNPTFFEGNKSLDYKHTKELLENLDNSQFLKDAIMTNDKNVLGIKFEPAKSPTATNYKIQNILQQIISIISIIDKKPQEGGAKDDVAPSSRPASPSSRLASPSSRPAAASPSVDTLNNTPVDKTVENIFKFFINELLTDIAKGIYNISTFTFNTKPFNTNVYKITLQDNIDKIFSVAIFIEHSIDMFIYKIEKYINLNFYFDDAHIKSAVKALEQSVFEIYSNKDKYLDILSTIIIDKITLYLDNLDDTPYKNDDYGNVRFQINEEKTSMSNITRDIKKDMDIIAGMILLRDNNNVLDMVVNTELKQRKGLDMPADDVVAKRDKRMVAEAARRSVEKLEADAARARANLS